MQHLWSPWRSTHIASFKNGNPHGEGSSLFSRLAGENRDEENLILWRGQRVFVIMNLYPYNNGHLMIVPFREVAAYEDLTADEQIEMALVLERCIKWLKEAVNPHGFNVGMNLGEAAGAGVAGHVHMHVVPRWAGDTNFMPTLADVKVVPESLRDTFRKLKAAIDTVDGTV